MNVAELLLQNFRGRSTHVAVATDRGFEPEVLSVPLDATRLQDEHLGGKRCLGFYLMEADSTVRCSCIDFDSKPERPDPAWREKSEQVYYALANLGLSPVVEISASGCAAHVWLFFSEPTDAWLVRAWWRALSRYLDVPFVEVYPRQDQLSGKGLGNLVRFPLWNQSRFVDVEKDWAVIEPAEAFATIKPTCGTDLKVCAFDIGCGQLKPEAPLQEVAGVGGGLSARVQVRLAKSYSLLARRWGGDTTGLADTSRSALLLSIATELVRTYVPTHEVEQALRHWCQEHGYDKGEREDWIDRTITKAYEFVVSRVEKKTMVSTTMEQACLAYLASLDSSVPRHVASGVDQLDASIQGLGFGEMAVIAARPSHGKSAFALQWLDTAARAGLPALIISEEMSQIELARRALCTISELEEADWQVNRDAIQTKVNDHYADRAPLHIQENCSTIERCEEIIDQFCTIHGVQIVAVDYLQLLGGRESTRYEVVSEISRKLKQCARRNNCALLALSQLNREVDKREDRVPKLSDLRESGQIEQDADLILFLQWPLRYDGDADPHRYLIYAAKRRNGPIRNQKIETTFDAPTQRFGPKTQFTVDDWEPTNSYEESCSNGSRFKD